MKRLTQTEKWILAALAVPAMCLCLVGAYFLPPVHDRLAWRVEELSLRVGYMLNPPAREVFVPQQAPASASPAALAAPQVTVIAPQSVTAGAGSPVSEVITPTLPAAASVQEPVLSPTASITPIATQPPLPKQAAVTGVRYEDQHGRWNYCAPANLSMALSYWSWEGNRDVVGPLLKPDEQDKNVMPYEMVAVVNEHTGLRALSRIGGDLDLIKRFIAAGYPVLVEKGTYLRDLTGVVSWMGHYQVVTGYDDGSQQFTTQDSFIQENYMVSYEEMIERWRAFNYTYIIVYPPEKEGEVMALLGPDADETTNAQNAALKAANEVYGLQGIDQYFAWFNRGSSLAALDDYMGAGAAYDEAFKVYPTLPESERPWRMLWYQTGPYFAYYYAQRYYDLLYLADGTLNAMQGMKNLEESYYWRGMARAALGDSAAAIEDFQLALKYHPDFEPAVYQLKVLGVQTP